MSKGSRIIETLGLAYGDLFKRKEPPIGNFSSNESDIYYRYDEGPSRVIFNTDDLYAKNVSISDVLRKPFINFTRPTGDTVFLTRTPERGFIRVWVPNTQEDINDIHKLLTFYNWLESTSFEDLATMPIQIGGKQARELRKKAIYFELDISGSGIKERFPVPNLHVEAFMRNDYGVPDSQPGLL